MTESPKVVELFQSGYDVLLHLSGTGICVPIEEVDFWYRDTPNTFTVVLGEDTIVTVYFVEPAEDRPERLLRIVGEELRVPGGTGTHQRVSYSFENDRWSSLKVLKAKTPASFEIFTLAQRYREGKTAEWVLVSNQGVILPLAEKMPNGFNGTGAKRRDSIKFQNGRGSEITLRWTKKMSSQDGCPMVTFSLASLRVAPSLMRHDRRTWADRVHLLDLGEGFWTLEYPKRSQ